MDPILASYELNNLGSAAKQQRPDDGPIHHMRTIRGKVVEVYARRNDPEHTSRRNQSEHRSQDTIITTDAHLTYCSGIPSGMLSTYGKVLATYSVAPRQGET